jgi:hypothetical protein
MADRLVAGAASTSPHGLCLEDTARLLDERYVLEVSCSLPIEVASCS